ncbi:hypothetical protein HUF15_40555 [Streptomyces samsunensis]|nr:hypothetical protein [Streptomyces samsunensis]
MSRSWKITVVALAVVGVASTPVVWLLDGPDAGQMAGACIQGAVGIAALVWALFQPAPGSAPAVAIRTGRARAESGGRAVSGIRRRRRDAPATVRDSGNATATGQGSSAISGIEEI